MASAFFFNSSSLLFSKRRATKMPLLQEVKLSAGDATSIGAVERAVSAAKSANPDYVVRCCLPSDKYTTRVASVARFRGSVVLSSVKISSTGISSGCGRLTGTLRVDFWRRKPRHWLAGLSWRSLMFTPSTEQRVHTEIHTRVRYLAQGITASCKSTDCSPLNVGGWRMLVTV